jgi:hypothetical protein
MAGGLAPAQGRGLILYFRPACPNGLNRVLSPGMGSWISEGPVVGSEPRTPRSQLVDRGWNRSRAFSRSCLRVPPPWEGKPEGSPELCSPPRYRPAEVRYRARQAQTGLLDDVVDAWIEPVATYAVERGVPAEAARAAGVHNFQMIS